MNFLITAIGSFSGEAVINSLKNMPGARIVGCDIYPYDWLPIARQVDFFYQAPIVYENEKYIDSMVAIIKKEKIDFVIPLTDPEVDLLSKEQKLIEENNVKICIPDEKTVGVCRNKLSFYKFFLNDTDVNVIPTYEAAQGLPGTFDFPMVAKPENGRSSEGLFIIKTAEELGLLIKRPGYIFQPFLKGDIFTVDFIRDKVHKRSFAIARKELIRTCNGAGMSVEVAPNAELETMAQKIGDKLDLQGCVNMEFILHKEKYFLMDINPRFSAGVAFSVLAGYDMPINHLRCFQGEAIHKPVTIKPMIIAKKLTDVITRG